MDSNTQSEIVGAKTGVRVSSMTVALGIFSKADTYQNSSRIGRFEERQFAGAERGRFQSGAIQIGFEKSNNDLIDGGRGGLLFIVIVSVAVAIGCTALAAMLGADLLSMVICYVCGGNAGLLGAALAMSRE